MPIQRLCSANNEGNGEKMSEELMDAQVAEETAPVSSPEEQTTVEETTNVSEDDLNTVEESAEEDVNVPLHENPRFKEVYAERKALKEENERLRSQLKPKEQPVYQPPQAKEISVEDIPQNLYDSEGNLDPIGYANWVVQESSRRAQEASRQEQRQAEAVSKAWAEAEKDYPELKDSEMRDLVDATVRGAFVRGEFMTPKEAASKILGRVRSAEKSGIKKAQVSTEIQKVATVPATESNPEPATTMEKTFLEAKQTGEWDNFFESFVKSKK